MIFTELEELSNNNKEINLAEDSSGYRLIFKIQEEAHRFAINYHRSLRSKKDV